MMDGHLDETDHVIFLGQFENNKRYKEKVLQEIMAAICAMLNSNGGKVMIHFDTDSSIPVESLPFSQLSLVIRILEQSMISIIGGHQTISKINFRDDKDSIIVFIKKADSLITINSNLYLPSETQVIHVSHLEPLEKVYKDIINRKIVAEHVQRGSHCQIFHKGGNCSFHECKMIEFKNLKANSAKRTKLADRMTGKGNKFSCYVSAFANHSGGHMYYGIDDDGLVEGEWIPNEGDKNEITKKVEKTINKMIWPQQIGQPKQGEHWDIFFEPVLDKDSKPIPSTFVIVIYIAPCLGVVFTEEPECYEMVEGKVKKMSFVAWKKRISNDQSSCSEVVPCAVSRIQWSSDEIKEKCTMTSNVLMELINNADCNELKRQAKIFQKKHPEDEVLLIVLSKMVIAFSRQSSFAVAGDKLDCFCKKCTKVVDSPFFNALASYLQIVLKRHQKDFEGIEELLADALANAELIEIGSLTAAIHLLAATVTSFKEQKSGSTQDELCMTAIEHLRYVEKPDSVTRDMEQKAYITLAFANLKCVLSKDIILDERCNEADLEEAKIAITAFEKAMQESPPSRFRKIQAELVRSVLYYRQAQLKKESTKSKQHLKSALEFAKEAEARSKKLAFDEMDRWSKTLISVCTGELVVSHFTPKSQH